MATISSVTMAKPIIKWAGGKTYLLGALRGLLEGFPVGDHHYCEPMVGGGAVYFAVGSKFRTATISDANPELVNLYKVVQGRVDDLIKELRGGAYFYVHKGDPATLENYRRIRADDPNCPVLRAARIVYLLKTCFNGLMRVNKSGRFNTPPGSYTDPTICDEAALRAASEALAGVDVRGPGDAVELLRGLPSGGKNLLFLDPPYHHPPREKTGKNGGKFTGYSGEFGDDEQAGLVTAMLAADCPFIYTNRATDFIVSLFDGQGAKLQYVNLKHSIQPRYTTGVVERELIAYRL